MLMQLLEPQEKVCPPLLKFTQSLFPHFDSGLNVEQRKRLTIGVELAAKPALLLFLDEPTSG